MRLILESVSYHQKYVTNAAQLLSRYNGEEPFSIWLKKFFKENRKYGSKDRKIIAHLCYCYFRLGKGLLNIPIQERILAAVFLCDQEASELLERLRPEWRLTPDPSPRGEGNKISFREKISVLATYDFQPFAIHDIFPWRNELSDGIEYEKFCESFLIQPDLFLRIRPGHENMVRKKLSEAGLKYDEISPGSLSLANSSKLDAVIELDREAVVQDFSSQNVAEFLDTSASLSAGHARNSLEMPLRPFDSAQGSRSGSVKVWDCCAGSGGKSILARDVLGEIDLTVSDVRESILANLKKRFTNAGIKNYKSHILDLSASDSRLRTPDYRLIICDAPCTGSGTWSRTPEQLFFFDPKNIDTYSSRQKKIVSNIIPHLKPDGHLLYITCSVFRKENEEVIEFIKQKFNLQLLKMELLKGYDKKADTLFAALLKT